MIFGLIRKDGENLGALKCLQLSHQKALENKRSSEVYRDNSVFFSCHGLSVTDQTDDLKLLAYADKGLTIVFSGRIYNADELRESFGFRNWHPEQNTDPMLILRLYERLGLSLLKKLNGRYAFGLWDRSADTLVVARDQIGIEPLYYYEDESIFTFASSIPLIFKYTDIQKELHTVALTKFLLFNYNPGRQTFFKGISKLRPAHYLTLRLHREKSIQRYWNIPFGENTATPEAEIAENLLEHLKKAVKTRLISRRNHGFFVSGGLDSSTVLALAGKHLNGNFHTFSYRCQMVSFDESHYAKSIARSVGAEHHEIEYLSRDLLAMPTLVEDMSEPFCDAGINLATYLLGKAAQGTISCALTGDGGDELFGGHPVYEADKIARLLDTLPVKVKDLFSSISKVISDGNQKKSLGVKLKRFTESLAFPTYLMANRWRIYYRFEELAQLLNPDLAIELGEHTLFADMIQYAKEAEGLDLLSRSLYSDYQTVVDFYLRRNDLTQRYGLQTHYPLLDTNLVEYCATIPPSLKIKGWFNTKYILKKSMIGVLPNSILYRKDKLGHSIPLKNWIREEKAIQKFLIDYLASGQLTKRGIFQPKYIQNLINDHLAKRRNNSHRLWSLAVLEMWLQKHLDNVN